MRRSAALPVVVLCGLLTTVGAPAAATATATRAELLADMDAAWETRAAPDTADRLRALEAEARTRPTADYETTWRSARTLWWLAHLEPTAQTRAALARRAAAVARHAIELDATRVEGHFMYAAAMGEYGASIGAARAIWEGVAGKFERAALAAYARDRDFDHGAPMLALGRYYFVLPWPLRDLDRSRRLLEELTRRHPDALLGRVWLAETLIALGERKRGRASLEHVLRAEGPGITRLAGQSLHRLARTTLATVPVVRAAAAEPGAPRS